ncbi:MULTISPECIES: hypothetical protein [unclassified Streptomyces]|uniref:hypothetical protein n=1 Tax=unclassified Streptomyces TaxID=2593676 RepID=UPI00382223B1
METPAATHRCFYIAPIGATGSDIRRRSDQILRHIVKPAAQECGYEAIRADEIDSSGLISTQVIERILGDGLVIADLTDHNPNVFYELAVRHTTGKPFIQIISEGQSIPFDVQGLRTIELDHQDLDSAADARGAIVRAIKAIKAGETVNTPMTYTMDLAELRNSDKAEERGVADILEVVKGIQRQLSRPATETASRHDLDLLQSVVGMWVQQGHLQRDNLMVLMGELKSTNGSVWLQELMRSTFPGTTAPAPDA